MRRDEPAPVSMFYIGTQADAGWVRTSCFTKIIQPVEASEWSPGGAGNEIKKLGEVAHVAKARGVSRVVRARLQRVEREPGLLPSATPSLLHSRRSLTRLHHGCKPFQGSRCGYIVPTRSSFAKVKHRPFVRQQGDASAHARP